MPADASRLVLVEPASDGLSEVDWEGLRGARAYVRWGYRAAHHAVLLLCLPLAVLLGLPIAVINAVIFRNPGKVFYRQPRVGHRCRVFWIYKFRTMREVDPSAFDSWRQGDERLRTTWFGRFLRNTHLDELPQVLNVLRGEMTLIGPRPEMVQIDRWANEVVPGFYRRHAVMPGITGWAQVTQGYSVCDPQAYAAKLRADDFYRRHMSLLLDLKILVRTAVWMVTARGWQSFLNRAESVDPGAQPAGEKTWKAAEQVTEQESCVS